MKCEEARVRGRRAVRLSSDALELVAFPGGGHLAEVRLPGSSVNPLWEPPWPTIEPEEYDPARHPEYGTIEGKLLSAIAGHTLCLNHFGELSEAELAAQGFEHGEAANLPWKVLERASDASAASLALGVELPEAGMRFSRRITLRKGSRVARLDEEVTNLRRSDSPLFYQQHVTLGPPFVEPGVTRLDLPGTRARTYPRSCGEADPLAPDRDFEWPQAPGARLDVFPDRKPLVTVTTVLLEPRAGEAFFAASNSRLGLALIYVFPKDVFPWVALWFENGGSAYAPFSGRTLAWGVEFGTSPFPVGRIEALSSGPLYGRRRFGVLPAKGTARASIEVALLPIGKDFRGVESVERRDGRLVLKERGGKEHELL